MARGSATVSSLFVYSEISSSFSLEQVLRFGSLPGVCGREPEVMIDILRAYTETYLKEEVPI